MTGDVAEVAQQHVHRALYVLIASHSLHAVCTLVSC